MYVRMYVRTYVCMYVGRYVYTYVHTYVRMYVCTNLDFCIQYVVSVSCKMLPIKLCFDGKTVTLIALEDH